MQNIEVENFVSDLILQKEKYAQMVIISKEQQNAIDKNDMETLAKFLEKKQTLLAEIEAIGRKISAIKANWATTKESVNPQLRGKVENIVDGIGKILKELIVLEEAGKKSMELKKGLVSSELKNLQVKKKVRNIYKQKLDEGSKILDSGNI